MNRSDYWLLDIVVELSWPLHVLTAKNVAEVVNQAAPHGLSFDELVETIWRLQCQGDIVLELWANAAPSTILWPHDFIRAITPTREELAVGLRGHESTSMIYKLTEQGGAHWEALARPNWDHYVDTWTTFPEEQDATLLEETWISSDRSLIEAVIAFVQERNFVIPGTIQWENHTPWQATYWKQLPCGHQVRYSARIPEQADLSALWEHGSRHWYTNPFLS